MEFHVGFSWEATKVLMGIWGFIFSACFAALVVAGFVACKLEESRVQEMELSEEDMEAPRKP